VTDVTRQEADPAASHTGVWFVGARGSVASTAIVGALALRSGLARLTGLVSELPEVAAARLPGLSGLVFGGHDIATISLPKRVEALAAAGVIPHHSEALASELAATDGGSGRECTATPSGRRPSDRADLRAFGQAHGLSRIVVDGSRPTASNETLRRPRRRARGGHWTQVLRHCRSARCTRTRRSGLAAAGGVHPSGRGYPQCRNWPGGRCPGRLDGKTGETLVKTALPMFASRALNVLSGFSQPAGGDGRTR
jgi:myo-inositol-1-phosphate synthase